ncbi:hypothetical protein D3C87_1703310 [compost metagenome]
MTATHATFDQHRVTGRDRLAETCAQLRRACRELPGQVQILQGHVPHNLGVGISEHLLGAGIEGADHPSQIRGDDRHLGRGIQHAA